MWIFNVGYLGGFKTLWNWINFYKQGEKMNARQRFGLGILIILSSVVIVKNPSDSFYDLMIYVGMIFLGFWCLVLN